MMIAIYIYETTYRSKLQADRIGLRYETALKNILHSFLADSSLLLKGNELEMRYYNLCRYLFLMC
jgi:hypothetical protein